MERLDWEDRAEDIEQGLRLIPRLGEVMPEEADEEIHAIYEAVQTRLRRSVRQLHLPDARELPALPLLRLEQDRTPLAHPSFRRGGGCFAGTGARRTLMSMLARTDLAERTGYSPLFLEGIVSGKDRSAPVDFFVRTAGALGLSNQEKDELVRSWAFGMKRLLSYPLSCPSESNLARPEGTKGGAPRPGASNKTPGHGLAVVRYLPLPATGRR